ncbi:MAG TPA: hypothetical protein VGH01_09695 [Jatrophihabitantaceae bacterium]
MGDTAIASAASRSSDSVESTVKGIGDDLAESIGAVLDATVKRGRKVRKEARKRAERELDQRRKQVRRAKKKATRKASKLIDASSVPVRADRRSPRRRSVLLGGVALIGAVALVLQRKAKAATSPASNATQPSSDVDASHGARQRS